MTFINLINEDSRVRLFTHNDLDGRGCEIVGEIAFKDITTTVVKHPQHASEKVAEYVRSGEFTNYDITFITDISVDEDTAKLIDDLEWESNRFVLLDHHGTALELNKYNWAHVEIGGVRHGEVGKNAGTTMFFDYLLDRGFFKDVMYRHALHIFTEKIRRYDCWEWKDKYDDKEAGALNQLFYLLSPDVFVAKYLRKFKNGDLFYVRDGSWTGMFDEGDRVVLDVDNAKKESYFELKNKQMFRMPYGFGDYAGVVFSEQYTSELGNYLSETNRDLLFIVLIDMGGKKVSLRTIHDNIDLGREVAKKFGGGGHAKASGFQFDAKHVVRLTDFIFQRGKLAKFLKIIDKILKL